MFAKTITPDHQSRFWAEKRIIAISFFITLAYFQYGYDSAAIAGFQSMRGFLMIYGHVDPKTPIGYNISTDVQRLIQSLINIGSFVSAFAIYFLGSRISRRLGLWIGCAFAFLSVSIMIGVKNLAGLYVGRLLLGMSNGFLVPYNVMFVSESAPSLLRGPILGMTILQTSLGALFGILVDNYTNAREGEEENAINSIRRLRGIKDEALLRAEVEDIRSAYEIEQELHAGVHLMDMFRGTDLRRTLLSYGCVIGGTCTGITFMAGFSVYLFMMAKVGKPFHWVMISLVVALTGNMLSFPAMRIWGRRQLIIYCSIGSAAMWLGMAIIYTVSGSKTSTDDGQGAAKGLVGLSIVYGWVAGVGQAGVLIALAAEIPSQRLRSQTVGTGAGINAFFGWMVSFFSPYFINSDKLNWGPKYGYIWGGSNLILAVWTWVFVPETKGRSLEQLDELFEKRVGARQFSSYVVARPLVDDIFTSHGEGGNGKITPEHHVEHREKEAPALAERTV
ncbi:general substrate transporter [Sordaria brevicollis]|uniref:General substrate transporter n=1 Tax=Sordaria brevicollis TaxID=83679 RepID=A0AAE0PNM6_SORBR|nr:general substrate transporter [Sordaria brevicollis]